jgi:hypothetical protein
MLYFFFLYALLRYLDDNNNIWHVFFIFYMFGISRVVEIKLIYITYILLCYYILHYKEKAKQRQLILTSGGGFELPLLACCSGFKAS